MIRELKTLIAVAREGTFAAAGDKIGLTQAAVSAQMKRLESELGFSLFERTGRSARLNPRGRQTLTQAEELCVSIGTWARPIAKDKRRLWSTSARSTRCSDPRCLTCWRDSISRIPRLPNARRSRRCPSELFNLVDAGEIELAAVIRPPFTLQSDLRWTTLAREPFRLIVPKQHRSRTDWGELLSSQPFVRYDRASFGGRQVDRFLRSAHVTVRELCELGELNAIVRLVAGGVGIALVPQTVDHVRWPAGVRAIDLGDHTFYREIGLIHRAASTLSEPTRALAQMFGAVYRNMRPVQRAPKRASFDGTKGDARSR